MKFLWSQSHWALKEFIGPTSSLYTELAGPINSLSAQNLTMELAAIKKILAGIIQRKPFYKFVESMFDGVRAVFLAQYLIWKVVIMFWPISTRILGKTVFFLWEFLEWEVILTRGLLSFFFFCYCYHILFDRFAKKVTQVDRHLMKARGYKAAITTKIGTIVCVQIM